MYKLASKNPLQLREKLLLQGAHSLADAELLAVFISSGNSKKNCLELAYDLLNLCGDLRSVLNAELPTFKKVAGLGAVRYLQLQAVREICRRSDFITLKKDTQLSNTRDTCAFLKRKLRDKKNETVVALFLDNQHRVIAYEELFQGTINAANVHTRPVIERTLALNAAALILAHNHPSGLADASEQDLQITKHLREALHFIDAQLLDHLIIGDNEVYSIVSEVKWVCH